MTLPAHPALDRFFDALDRSIIDQSLVKLLLSDRRDKKSDLTQVIARLVTIKKGLAISCTYRHTTKDIVKNYDPAEARTVIRELLDSAFRNADLYSTAEDLHLMLQEKGPRITASAPRFQEAPSLDHNKAKARLVDPHAPYLHALGITDAAGIVKPTMQDKFKQIDKYIEIVDGLLNETALPAAPVIADMGSGKGYLTFALYDHLVNHRNMNPRVSGIETRQELVDLCNRIAADGKFTGLSFTRGTIATAELTAADMVIALHACDTATDDAIYKGIVNGAKLIIAAPCCHKEVRKQLTVTGDANAFLEHGILAERQAEIATDALRALLLEASGYAVKVFEFISSEHTAKNVMLVARKLNRPSDPAPFHAKIAAIKAHYGITEQRLETLLRKPL
ncbi:MAG TPA: SAM-dependent methyltransferase [bacterium]|nr:SAM-dependent methyltransferase [bacterium]